MSKNFQTSRLLPASLLVSLVSVLAALLVPTMARAEWGQLDEFGGFGTGNGEFTFAKSIAVDPNGPGATDDRIFVLDLDLSSLPNRFRIEEFDGNGTFLRVLDDEVGNPFTFALLPKAGDIAVDPARNRLYLTRPRPGTSRDRSSIQMYDISQPGQVNPTNFVANTANLKLPEQIAVDTVTGNVFVAGNDRDEDPKLRRYTPAGTSTGPLFGFEAPNNSNIIDPGEFGDETDIDDLGVRNTNPTTGAAKVYTLDLWTQPTEEEDYRPTDPEEDAARVQRFTHDGTNSSPWAYDGTPTRPSTGEFFSTEARPFNSANLAVEADGEMFLNRDDTDGVIKFNEAGGELQRFGTTGTGDCKFSSPPDMTIGPDNTLLALDRNATGGAPQRVLKFGEGGSGCSDVPNSAPTAAFDFDPASPQVGQQVNFDGSGSSDSDGSVVKYEWDLDGDGSFETDTGTTPTTSRSYTTADTVNVQLRVTDDDGESDVVDHDVTVFAANVEPTAAFTFNPNSPETGQQVNFDGSGSSDSDGNIVKYEWDLDGNGSFETDTGTTPTTSRSYTTAGTVNVKLRVTDDDGVADTVDHDVTMVAANVGPTAAFTTDPNPSTCGQQVNFDGSGSSDSDGNIAKYEWDLDGNGSFETDTGAAATTTRTYTGGGVVNVKLRVTDDDGAQGGIDHDLTVNCVSGIPVFGTNLVLGDNLKSAGKRKIVGLFKDVAIGIGDGNGSADDPILHGGSVRVVGATFDYGFELPSNRWKLIGKAGQNKGYNYVDSKAVEGPIKTAMLKPGKPGKQGQVKINGMGAALTHTLATNPGPVSVIVTVGDQRFCTEFGGEVKFKANVNYTAKKAPAPGDCIP